MPVIGYWVANIEPTHGTDTAESVYCVVSVDYLKCTSGFMRPHTERAYLYKYANHINSQQLYLLVDGVCRVFFESTTAVVLAAVMPSTICSPDMPYSAACLGVGV